MNENIKEFEVLFDEFERLLPLRTAPKTFLEITRFPHSELACSNILKFFLDPKEEHGFGDLFLRSILEASDPAGTNSIPDLDEVSVIREDRTDSNKSIDIVVDGASFVLGIENKIFADASYNPFTDYSKWLNERAGTKKRVYKVLLTLNPAQAECDFKPVTYEQLFAIIEKHLGPRVVAASERHLTFFREFITTIKNLRLGTHMDRELLALFKGKERTVHKFYISILELIGELRERGEDAKKAIQPMIEALPGIKNLQARDDSKESGQKGCVYCIWCEAQLGQESSLGLELQVRASGWRIIVWPSPEEAFEQVRERFVDKCGIELKPVEGEEEVWLYQHLPYDEAPEVAARKFVAFIKLVCTKLPKKR